MRVLKINSAFLAISLLIFIASCSKESTTNLYSDNQILGSWSYTSVTINGEESVYIHKENCLKDYITFLNNEGQYHQFNEILHFDEECHINATNLDWRISGSELILNFGSQKFVYEIEELTTDTLQFSGNIDIDNNGTKEFIAYKFNKYILP